MGNGAILCAGVERYPEEPRERWLSADEIGAFTAALDAYRDQNAANALRLLLLTGAREGEVLKADWSQFDLDRGVWTKPSHHTKEKKTEHVPLNDQALALLRTMKRGDAKGRFSLAGTVKDPARELAPTLGGGMQGRWTRQSN